MAASNLNLGKASGGILSVSPADGTTNTSLVLPASGTVVATDVAVTDNAIARYDGTTGKVQNSSVIIDDSGNIGVSGSSYPNITLTNISSSTTFPLIALQDLRTNAHSWNIEVGRSGNALSFRDNNASDGVYERMRIDSSGNVGIGVTPSAWANDGYTKALNIGRHGSISSSIVKQAANIEIGGNYYYTTPDYVDRYMESGWAANKYEQSATGHKWYVAPSGTAGSNISWTNAMTLDSNGKLVFGSNVFSARMSFTGDYAAYGDTHITMRNNPSTNYGNIVFQNAAGTQVGYIQASNTGTAYVVSSDYRLKEDIKPMLGSIERLMELKPCNFKWKETGTRVDGFIAHELQEVVPEAALGVKDEMMEEEYELSPRVEATYDEEGNELTPVIEAIIGKREVPKYQGIDQSKLVPLLTSALQDAILKIESLESRIKILEGAK